MPRLQLLWLLASLGHAHVLQPRTPETSPSLQPRQYDANVVKINAHAKNHNHDFFSFVTRPDIDAPRWDIKKYNEAAMAPGYWFAAPYQDPQQDKRGGGWVGPHIYDQDGELVWSGVPMLKGFDAFDFKVSKYKGEDMLSMIYRHENGIFLNSNYEMEDKFYTNDNELNMHDFSTAEDGETVLMLKVKSTKASEETLKQAGLDYECKVHFYGFEEVNATTGEALFNWWSEGPIGVEETFFEKGPEKACQNKGNGIGLDYIHANALDKFPDGNYLLSGRHCNTIYKISAKDGSIIWRFGGRNSDFKWDGHFTGQHHARVRSQNSTHTVISFLDNAFMPAAKPVHSNDMSRGFLIALRTDTEQMTAETISQFDHPQGGYAPGRGSYQVLPNGNTFVGWTSYSLHSEYDTQGNLIMEASVRPELKSYRSYKFPWVGHPTEPPAVRSFAVATGANDTVTTDIHVSWNGATEVAKWNLYRTTGEGLRQQLLLSTPRTGFETAMAFQGHASHVVLEAIDVHGEVLGRSEVTKTIGPYNKFIPEVVEADKWEQLNPARPAASAPDYDDDDDDDNAGLILGLPISLANFAVAFAFGVIACAIATTLGFSLWRLQQSMKRGVPVWRWKGQKYSKVTGKEDVEESFVDETLVADDDNEEGRYEDKKEREGFLDGAGADAERRRSF